MRSARLMLARIRNVPGLASNLTVTIATIVVGIVAIVFLFQHYDVATPWKQERTFSAVFDRTIGMRAQSKHKVEIAGVEVGTVRGIEAQQNNTALVTMAIDPQFEMYKNAHVEMRTMSPVNDIVIALEPGTPEAGEMPEEGVIPLSHTSRLIPPSDILDKLDDRSQAAITSLVSQADIALRDAPRELPPGLDATRQTVASLKPVVSALDQRRATLQRLISNLSDISTAAGSRDERLASLIASLQQTLATLSARDDNLNSTLAQLPELRGNLDRAVTSVSGLTGQLNPILDALHGVSGELPGTVQRLKGVVDQAGPVVDAAAPVVSQARPVVADLRPLVGDVRSSVDDLKPVTGLLPDATSRLVPWLPNLQAFVYQTSSAFSIADANGGQGRAKLDVDILDPTGSYGAAPETEQNTGRQGR